MIPETTPSPPDEDLTVTFFSAKIAEINRLRALANDLEIALNNAPEALCELPRGEARKFNIWF
jgi:hypothetical protein